MDFADNMKIREILPVFGELSRQHATILEQMDGSGSSSKHNLKCWLCKFTASEWYFW